MLSNTQPTGTFPRLSQYRLLKLLVLRSRTQWAPRAASGFTCPGSPFRQGIPEPPSSFTALALWRRTGLSFCGTSPECLLAAHDPMRAGHWQERRGRGSGVSSACASGGPPCSSVASPGVLTWSLGEDDVRGGSRRTRFSLCS